MQKRQKTRDPVLVLSQNEILCEGLKSIVVKMPRLQLAGATTQVDNLEDLTRLLNPKVILLALADGCDKELEAVQALTSEFSDLAVLVLDNRPSPNRLNWFLLAGARGYFPMETNLRELLASLDLAYSGLFSVDARLADRFRGQVGPPSPEAGVDFTLEDKRLNAKEKGLLQLLMEGKTNQQIADALSYSLSTVKNLCQRLFIKLGVENRLQAVIMTYDRRYNGNSLQPV